MTEAQFQKFSRLIMVIETLKASLLNNTMIYGTWENELPRLPHLKEDFPEGCDIFEQLCALDTKFVELEQIYGEIDDLLESVEIDVRIALAHREIEHCEMLRYNHTLAYSATRVQHLD